MMDTNAMPPAQESGVLRYYSSSLLLRMLTTDADAVAPRGASFSLSRAAADAPFLSLTESHLVAPLVRAPSVAVVEAGEKLTRGVFTVLPAEGFVKQRGEPVYYNEPIQLMDQRGRLLGIATRAPFAGHLAADGHSGALVFVLERHAPRRFATSDRFRIVKQHSGAFRRSLSGTSSSDGSSTPECDDPHGSHARPMTTSRATGNTPHRSSLVQVCGGDRLRIPGLIRVVKKHHPGGCIMQPKLEDGGRTSRNSMVADDEPPSLLCEVVLTSAPSFLTRSDSTSSSSSSSTHNHVAADRTATGDYVGVLHTGILHRRSDHMKLWKKRFFVLTQVALHRFDAHETLQSVRTQKARGSISLTDCRSVRYERFSRPHELELELSNGKVFALHAEDALTCSEWASVLSRAIENPQWVHAERNCLTVWRSDAQYESPQCPVVTKVVLRRGRGTPDKPFTYCGGRGEPDAMLIASSPQWNEKLTLGSITASGSVAVQLADGNVFRLTLEDLSRSLVQPRWLAVATSLEVDRIHAVGDDDASGPQSVGHKSESDDGHKADKSRFVVRLKFQADLQLDQRLGQPRRSFDAERRLVLGVPSALVLVPAVVCGFYHSLSPLARSLCLVSASLVVAALIAFAPVAWQMYLWMRYGDSMEGELHWFLTLLAIEVRPHIDEISDRRLTLSGEENRLRLSSFIHSPGDDEELDEEDGDDSEDAAIVVPTKTPLYGLEASLLQDGSHPRASPQAIRAFRLENALDTILARPLLPFFAIKSFFPSTFLPRDPHGRRVLLVSLNEMDRSGLAHHNISGFNVVRYFLYLWEFMWSYQDLHEGVSHSQLVVVVDCSGWPYFKWFSIECQVMLLLLNTTYRFYPNRLARVVFVRNHVSFGIYGRLFRKGLDPGLRDLVETCETMPSSFANGDTPSPDEMALHDFVTNVLATHANAVIPRFTRRELEQATRLTTTGSLLVDDDDSRLDAIGTLAVVVPTNVHATLAWQPVVDGKEFAMWKSTDPEASVSVQGKTYQSDARAVQWRGRYTMKTTNADHVVKMLQDPRAATGWLGGDAEQLVVLQTLSSQEDVCFWSRRVPFMNFSLSGHRVAGGSGTNSLSHVPTNAFYHSVLRRIHEIKPGRCPRDRVAIVLWKTPSAQHFVVNRPSTPLSDEHERVQWRKLEDPYVSLCYVVEEEAATKIVTLRLWYQSFSPPTTPTQDAEIAHLIERKLRALDDAAVTH